jgi:hypothetical protein
MGLQTQQPAVATSHSKCSAAGGGTGSGALVVHQQLAMGALLMVREAAATSSKRGWKQMRRAQLQVQQQQLR